MHCEPRCVRILLAEGPSSFQKRPRYWRCSFQRVENLANVIWIRRLNPVHNIWIVSNRLSSRYLVRGFGFCDLNSPDISRRTVVIPAFVIKLVLFGMIAGLPDYAEAITRSLIVVATNLLQRLLELSPVALPLNVCRSFLLTFNLHRVRCDVWDDWKGATADNRNDHDYG